MRPLWPRQETLLEDAPSTFCLLNWQELKAGLNNQSPETLGAGVGTSRGSSCTAQESLSEKRTQRVRVALGAHLAGRVTSPRETGKAYISVSKSSAFCIISLVDEALGVEFIMRTQSLHWLMWLLGQPPAGKWGVKDFLMETSCQVPC